MPKSHNTKPLNLASAALKYVQAGWAVFPLLPGGKTPLHKGGVNDATTDEAAVRRWWTKSPRANIGIALKRSGLGVIDLDVKPEKGKDGVAMLETLMLVDGELGEVAVQTTPSGGRHHVFKQRGSMLDKVDWRKGIDILTAKHRYIVAEPSVLDGRKAGYTWDAPAPWTRCGTLRPVWAGALAGLAAQGLSQPEDPLLGSSLPKRDAEDLLLDSAALRVPGASLDELDSILAVLDSSMGRDPWLRVLWGAAAQWAGTKHEQRVIDALDAWSSSTSTKGQYKRGEVQKRWEEHTGARGGRSGTGHVTWRGVRAMARQSGWSPFSLGGVDPKEWKTHLHTKGEDDGEGGTRQIVVSDAWNASLFLAYDKGLAGGIKRNVMTDAIEIHRAELAPLRDPTRLPIVFNQRCDWIGVGSVLKDKMKGAPVGREGLCAAVEAAAAVHAYDPMRDWIEGLAWDGEKRIDTWLSRVCGVHDTPLNRAIARKWIIGMAGRASAEYDGRGVKMDSVLVLQGGEGIGKSTVGAIFGGEWYASFSNSLNNDDIYYVIEKSMVLEFDELDSMSRSEATRVKSLVTTQADTFRRKYDRNAASRPRRCVFIGTTNDEAFLTRDMTMRRWWIVKCPPKLFDLRWLKENRDQLVAEAKVAWDMGELPMLPREVRAAQNESVESVRMVHPYEELVASWSSTVKKAKGYRMQECVEGALARGMSGMTMSEMRKFGESMRAAGWDKERMMRDGIREVLWVLKAVR